jgi:hypothetical protein
MSIFTLKYCLLYECTQSNNAFVLTRETNIKKTTVVVIYQLGKHVLRSSKTLASHHCDLGFDSWTRDDM